MSDYGADPDPDLAAAFDLQVTKGFTKQNHTNVMQWTYDDCVVRKLANRRDGTNCLFKMDKE